MKNKRNSIISQIERICSKHRTKDCFSCAKDDFKKELKTLQELLTIKPEHFIQGWGVRKYDN